MTAFIAISKTDPLLNTLHPYLTNIDKNKEGSYTIITAKNCKACPFELLQNFARLTYFKPDAKLKSEIAVLLGSESSSDLNDAEIHRSVLDPIEADYLKQLITILENKNPYPNDASFVFDSLLEFSKSYCWMDERMMPLVIRQATENPYYLIYKFPMGRRVTAPLLASCAATETYNPLLDKFYFRSESIQKTTKDEAIVPLQIGNRMATGVMVADGYILTNRHHVKPHLRKQVKVTIGEFTYKASIIPVKSKEFPDPDLVLLHISNLHITPMSRFSGTLPNNSPLTIVGYPLKQGYDALLTRGRTTNDDINSHGFAQTTAIGLPGMSGGAVMAENGALVGIITRMHFENDVVIPFKHNPIVGSYYYPLSVWWPDIEKAIDKFERRNAF